MSTPHPALEPVLAETFGVIIYHEQVMGVLSVLTGCDASTADLLRRRLGDEVGRRLVHRQVYDRARERGFPPDVIEKVFADVASFASFGFCKAHAAAFAVPTERSAFLKAHLFPEFMAGLITHDPGMYPRRMIVEECRLFGVPVLGPDVIGSSRGADVVALTTADADVRLGLKAAREAKADGCEVTALLPAGWSWPAESDRPLPPTGRDAGQRRTPSGEVDAASRWAVQLGLDGVAGLGGAEIDRILAGERPTDLRDLRDRIGVERTGALALGEAGALDRLARVGAPSGPRDRRALRLAVEETWSSRRPRRAVAQQTSLLMFEDAPSDLPSQPLSARVRDELVSTGVELSAHVVSFYAPLLDRLGVVGAHALREIATGERVRVAGVRVALQSPPQRSGNRVMFLTLDDRTGQVQVTFFSRALPDCAFTVSRARLVVAEGVVARRGQRGATVIGRRAWDLTRLWAAWQDGRMDMALRERGTPAPHLVGDGSRSTMVTRAASGQTLRSADGGRASR